MKPKFLLKQLSVKIVLCLEVTMNHNTTKELCFGVFGGSLGVLSTLKVYRHFLSTSLCLHVFTVIYLLLEVSTKLIKFYAKCFVKQTIFCNIPVCCYTRKEVQI